MKGKIIHIDSKLKSVNKKVVINAQIIRIETNPAKIRDRYDEISLAFEMPNIPNKTFLLKLQKGKTADSDIGIGYEKITEIINLQQLQSGAILANKLFEQDKIIFR